MPSPIDITGETFGRLRAIRQIRSDRHGKRVWLFACECGSTCENVASAVKRGAVKSCGCLHRERAPENARKAAGKIAAAKTKHGLHHLPEYAVWKSMRQRCRNPRNQDYPSWGGRGISVCERWNDFANFYEDMGPRPTDSHSIDRINNDGNYEPDNCRWATHEEQAANRRERFDRRVA